MNKILLSNTIRYLGNDRFGFSCSGGLEFNYHDSALRFYANASGMKCYRNNSNDVMCEVAGLKFIVPFPFGSEVLKEIFLDKIYGEPYCYNAVVVDVGAFIGDSPLFFASRGAKKVISFEPVPPLFSILKKNVALNGYNKIIQAKNEAVSDITGCMKTRYDQTSVGASSVSLFEDITYKIILKSLSEIIFSLGWVDILKMDCEGCEHKVLWHAKKTGALKYVGMIIMEIHSKADNIIELLKDEGFSVIKFKQTSKNLWFLNAQRCARIPRVGH